MAEQQDFNSLDELFRKSFNDLPESSAASGWDQPDDRVWQHVQARIKPPRQGWTSGQMLLAASAAVAIALGIYLAFAQPQVPATTPESTEQTAATPQSKTPEIPENTAPAGPTESPESTPTTVASPSNTIPASPIPRNTVDAPAQPQPRQNAEPVVQPAAGTAGQRAVPSGSAPLPGSRPVSPNTTELRKNEGARRGLWAVPLKPLPSALERRQAPPLPASIRLNLQATDPGKQ